MSTYWEIMYSELGQRSKVECFRKIIIVFNFFLQKNSFLNLWEGSAYVLNVRVLNIHKFS